MTKNHSDELHARVFISCGQDKDSGEATIATQILTRLQALGFDPYVAVVEQTLRGLKENIFDQLTKSEYFIFVDFKREPLGSTTPTVYRGSLFTHQELAIASFLDIEVLAFQESGTKQDDGIFKFLQANAIQFTDRHLLPDVIVERIRQRKWDAHWRNELVLQRECRQFVNAERITGYTVGGNTVTEYAKFFHINVQNRHRIKTATNCYVYLEKAINLKTSEEIPLKPIEFKWAGTVLPYIQIPPGKARSFDAFYLYHARPTDAQFNVYSDATDFFPRLQGAGRYELAYLVLSGNFPPSRKSFTLDLNPDLDLTSLK